MRATHSKTTKSTTAVVLLGLALAALVGSAGCDETYNLATWDGLAMPGYTSSLGLPESPSSYWASLGYGVQNVPSWGGLADPWYTSSLGLPQMP
ncbi:MAG: hypothetical protein JXA69_08805 [Phycisphaerae bacterium]|nr:hypothetical protein [Phycisphaerae bacterium]